MKKPTVILLCALLILASSPAFAGYDVAPGGAENLKHYGFISGGTGGDLMTNQTLDRQQMAILVCELNGKKEQARIYTGASAFTDEASFPDWSRSFISYARLNRWMNGLPDGRFDNLGTVSGQQLATAMLNVLGRPHAWGEGIATLRSLGVEIPDLPSLTRGQAFDAMWKVVSTPIMSDGKILGEATGRLIPKTVELLSVSANNLSEIVFRFNEPIVASDLTEANIKVDGVFGTFTLKPGAREAILTAAKPLTNQREYTATAQNIRLAADMNIRLKPTVQKFKALDKTMPKILNVEFSGPRSVTIVFDEPIRTGGKLEVKSGSSLLSVNHGSLRGYSTARITAELFSPLKEGTAYDITASEFEDLAGYRCEIGTQTVTYQKSGSAPTVSAEETSQAFVKLRFDRPVQGLSPDNFWHSLDSRKAVKLTRTEDPSGVEIKPGDSMETVYVWFFIAGGAGNNPLPAGSVKFGALGKATTSISDSWGTVLADTLLMLNVSGASEKPRVTEMQMISPDILRIRFNTKVTKPDVAVTKKDGSPLTGYATNIPKQGPDLEYEVVFNKAVTESVIRVSVKNAEELSVNQLKMDDYAVDLTVADRVPPTLQSVGYTQTGSDHFLYFIFSKPMGPSALQPSNYQMTEGGYTSLSEPGVFYPDSTTVRIRLTPAQLAKFKLGTTQAFVSNVRDEADNLMTAVTADIVNLSAAATITAEEAAFVSPTKAYVLFNQLIAQADPDAFVLGGDAMTILGQEETGSRTLFWLQPKKPLTIDEQDAVLKLDIAKDTLTGLLGHKNTSLELSVADMISPRAVSIEFLGDRNEFVVKLEGKLEEPRPIKRTTGRSSQTE